MREPFIEWRPQGKSHRLLFKANKIAEELAARGYSLTLRQLYYQLVSQDVIPNNQLSYDRLGELISNGRLAGQMDWDLVEDRTRHLRGIGHEGSVVTALDTAARTYHLDHWEDQDRRVEVWVEKDALVDVIGKAAGRLDVNFFSCRGYTSSTAMYRAAKRHLRHERDNGAATLILHLGDHDPSGLDMTRDITERLAMFGADTEVRRIALNMDQIEAYDPPANPAKLSDSKAKKYIEEYGPSSWELDALDPEVLENLITEGIEGVLDRDKFDAVEERQTRDRLWLRDVAAHKPAIDDLAKVEWDLPDVEAIEQARADAETLASLAAEERDEARKSEAAAKGYLTTERSLNADLKAELARAEAAWREEADKLRAKVGGVDPELLRGVMAEVGDTTRAASLKKKIEELF